MPDQSPRPSPLDPRPSIYRGRFAPSPTGPLHFGSLIAAVGSYLEAKSQQGEWLLRIDDIDPPREVAGAGDAILRTLENFGFEWDGPVTYQSRRHAIYLDALATLQDTGRVYPCACSRKRIAESQAGSGNKSIYPGTCRAGLGPDQTPRMLRIDSRGPAIHFADRIQGPCVYELETELGDFVVRRADGLFAYQLATGVDDALQGISEVVRGRDLLDSTPCQILIQQRLDLATPVYAHLPVAVNQQGQKLSKQNLAPALDTDQAPALLWQALNFLGQNAPSELRNTSLDMLWQWAFRQWQPNNIPRRQTIQT